MKKKYVYLFFLIFVHLSILSMAQVQFIEHTIDSNVHGTGGIYACDIDKDNDLDVLGASLEDNQIILWRNDGGYPIVWTKIIIGSNIYSAHSVHAADFDGDDTLDVVSAQYSGTPGVAWWKTNLFNPISWTKINVASSFINAHEVYSHDLDKDGDFDVLGASSNLNRIAWWRNDGGTPIIWTEQILSSSVTLAKSVTVGDLDGDQDNDIIGVSIVNNDVIWWRNDGGQPIQWTQFLVDGNFGGAHRVQVVDIDDDTDLDILGAGYIGHQIAWWRNDGGNPIQWTKFTISNNFIRPWPLYACDLDGDTDNDIIVGSSHNGGNYVKWWENTTITGVIDNRKHPKNFELKQNYPNPFNPLTTIEYKIPENTHVVIKVYNSLGEEVTTLINEEKESGSYEIIWNAINVTCGIYFYKIKARGLIETKKMLLLK